MGTKSHGFQITLQYCLWDFLRELGEKGVGGEEMIQKISEESGTAAKVSTRRIANLAKLYAWCVAKEVLTLAIFKVRTLLLLDGIVLIGSRLQPVPFGRPRPQTIIFLQQFFTSLIISSQSPSPALILTSTGTRRDKESLERIFVKAAPFDTLLKGMLYFFETTLEEEKEKGEKEAAMIKWGVKVAKETMGVGGGIIDVR
jgi:nucleolar MIF4G domain-containing protein 1